MSSERLNRSETPSSARPRHGLDAERPTIKILLYTDDPDDIVPDDPHKDLGLVRMLEHLSAREPEYAKLSVKWVSRHSSNQVHADQKLDKVLEEELQTGHQFDEIWFFGLQQANKERRSFGVFRGTPESELTIEEVSILRVWMDTEGDKSVGGGVLLTGDHNHPRPIDTVPSTNPLCPGSAAEPFLGRGRAIGRCVPRAGQLRKWEGEPTNEHLNSNNTIASSGFQSDKLAQELILRNVDTDGNPDPNGEPHPIFKYKPGQWIRFFPDHIHEGEVTVELPTVDPELWPKDVRPHVVAKGVDSRQAELIDLVATYNGDLADVGRIVADSSWHHYFNINLESFTHPAPEGSPGDQIGQFYVNLAVWLAPRSTRKKMLHAMLWQLANYTAQMEPLGHIMNIGSEANSKLRRVAPCETHELLQALVPERYGRLSFAEGPAVLSHLPSRELLLGCVLNSYHNEMIRDENSDELYEPQGIDRVIESGFHDALKEQATQLGFSALETLKLMSLR